MGRRANAGFALLVIACSRPQGANAPRDQAITNSVQPPVGAVQVPAVPSADRIPFGQPLGEFIAAHPGDSILIAAPGLEGGVSVADPVEDGVPGVWCARVSHPVDVSGGYVAFRRWYFFLVAPDSVPPPPRSDAAFLRGKYCRLGVVSSEVQVGHGKAMWQGRQLDSVLESLPLPQLPGRREGDVWPGQPAGCMDAKYGFYGPAGNTWACVARYAIDSGIAAPEDFLGARLGDDIFRSANLDPFGGELDPFERRISDSLDGLLPRAQTPSSTDTVALDSGFVRVLATLAERVPGLPARERALGWLLLDKGVQQGIAGTHFGWPPIDEHAPVPPMVVRLGAEIGFDESGFELTYSHNLLDSAESLHLPGVLGDSIYVWAVGQSIGCRPFGGGDFARVIERSRFYAGPTRTPELRRLALRNIAIWSASSMGLANAGGARSFADSVSAALGRILALEPPEPMRAWARRGLWRARAGLAPLAPYTNCEYLD